MMVGIFGILNITPDSFSDGNKFMAVDKALAQAGKLIGEGADYVDVGGEATNPWAKPIDANQEWTRIEKIVSALLKNYRDKISLDTRHPETARRFLELGGTVLNDVSGFCDPKMIEVASIYKPLCIINHFPGSSPAEVHKQQVDDAGQVKSDLLRKAMQLQKAGIPRDKIILDPGIGFGKTMDLNSKLLNFPQDVPDWPVMIGYSRKRFLGDQRFELDPNLEAAKQCVKAGAKYLRVHDVAPTVELLKAL